jgi:hypothetical protein
MFLVYCQRVVNAKLCHVRPRAPRGFMAMPRDSGGLASLGSCKYEEEVIELNRCAVMPVDNPVEVEEEGL